MLGYTLTGPWLFLLKMISVFNGGNPPFKEKPIYISKLPRRVWKFRMFIFNFEGPVIIYGKCHGECMANHHDILWSFKRSEGRDIPYTNMHGKKGASVHNKTTSAWTMLCCSEFPRFCSEFPQTMEFPKTENMETIWWICLMDFSQISSKSYGLEAGRNTWTQPPGSMGLVYFPTWMVDVFLWCSCRFINVPVAWIRFMGIPGSQHKILRSELLLGDDEGSIKGIVILNLKMLAGAGLNNISFPSTPAPRIPVTFFQISLLIHPFWVICRRSTYGRLTCTDNNM